MMEARRQQEEVERQEALGRQREADEERARLSSWGHRFGIDSGWRGLGRGQAQRHRGGRRTRELGTLSFSPNSPPFGCRGRGDGRGQQQRWDDFPQQEQGDIRGGFVFCLEIPYAVQGFLFLSCITDLKAVLYINDVCDDVSSFILHNIFWTSSKNDCFDNGRGLRQVFAMDSLN